MDGARFSDSRPAYFEEADGAAWAGSRSSVRPELTVRRWTGSQIGLAALVLLGFVLTAQSAAELAPRLAPVQVAVPETQSAEAAAAETPAQTEERPLAVGPDPEVTDNGLTVEPWRWPNPLTVSERTVLRATPGEALSDSRGAAQPGRPLRVIGRVRVESGAMWLQVRTEDGGVAYLDSADVLEVADFRAREREEAARVRAEAEAAAQAAALSVPGVGQNSADVPPSETPPQETVPAPGELY